MDEIFSYLIAEQPTMFVVVILLILSAPILVLFVITFMRRREPRKRDRKEISSYPEDEFGELKQPLHKIGRKKQQSEIMKSHTTYKVVIFILVIICVCVGYVTLNQEQHEPRQRVNIENLFTTTTTTRAEPVSFPPLPFPETSPVIENYDVMLFAPFHVAPPLDGEHNYVIRLKHIENKDYNRDFYIRAGETLETIVLHGEYVFYYTLGINYYGSDYLFGPNTLFFRGDRTLLFYFDEDENSAMGREIYLEPVVGGTFTQTPIDFSEFNE
jgi:hypothetical protein